MLGWQTFCCHPWTISQYPQCPPWYLWWLYSFVVGLKLMVFSQQLGGLCLHTIPEIPFLSGQSLCKYAVQTLLRLLHVRPSSSWAEEFTQPPGKLPCFFLKGLGRFFQSYLRDLDTQLRPGCSDPIGSPAVLFLFTVLHGLISQYRQDLLTGHWTHNEGIIPIDVNEFCLHYIWDQAPYR